MQLSVFLGQFIKTFCNLKMFRRNSIFVKNFIFFTLLEIFAISVLTSLYTNKMEASMMDEIRESNAGELKRSAENLDSIIEQMYNLAYYVASGNDVKMLYIDDSSENVSLVTDLRDRIYSYSKIFEYVDSMYLYVEKSGYIISESGKMFIDSMTDTNWLSAYEAVGHENYLLTSRCADGKYPFLLTMVHPIFGVQNKKIGAVLININLEELNDAIGRDYNDEQRFYMTDEENNLYYSNVVKAVKYAEYVPESLKNIWQEDSGNGKYFEIREENGEKVVISASKAADGKRMYWLYTPMAFYSDRIRLTKEYTWQITLWSIIFSFIMSYVLAMQSYRPIQRIMSNVESEGDNIRDEFINGENQQNEVSYISNLILNAKRKNTRLELEVEEWMNRLGQAQLQALQEQINPHFLYNTLDTINWMAMEKTGGVNEISRAIYTLAQLLRMSMKRSSYLIPLEEELEHVKLYMELLDIRYPGKLTVHWNMEAQCYEVKVVRLCLQPILENAVSHGLRSRRYQGNVYIKGNIVSNTLVIRIEDDGIGMSVEDCHSMNRILNTEYQMVDNHVGIKNVNQRLKILFGENYGIQLRPREEGGLVVVLCFPI